MSALTDVTKKAMALPVEVVVSLLAQRVWESVQHFASRELEKEWLDEADHRWQEIEERKVHCEPADAVMKRARKSLER